MSGPAFGTTQTGYSARQAVAAAAAAAAVGSGGGGGDVVMTSRRRDACWLTRRRGRMHRQTPNQTEAAVAPARRA